jgi:hypothetical protein
MIRWEQGRSTVEDLLARRELDKVKADRALADELLNQAARHVKAAATILGEDPVGSLGLAYEAAYKGFGAVLENQGLRATVSGGHKALEEAVRAQLVPPSKDLIDAFGWMRKARHASTYVTFERASATLEDATRAIAIAEEVLEKSAKLLDAMPAY